jgi:hypothetical protein
MKFKILVISVSLATLGYFASETFTDVDQNLNGLQIANVEALSSSESGAKCPNGCSDIGWGWNKILECDCDYDHFSCCDKWGC